VEVGEHGAKLRSDLCRARDEAFYGDADRVKIEVCRTLCFAALGLLVLGLTSLECAELSALLGCVFLRLVLFVLGVGLLVTLPVGEVPCTDHVVVDEAEHLECCDEELLLVLDVTDDVLVVVLVLDEIIGRLVEFVLT